MLRRWRERIKRKAAILRGKWYSTRWGKRGAVKRYRKKHNSKDWPLEYIGPTIQGKLHGQYWSLETGQPLRYLPGMKAGNGGGSYISPDGVERTIHKKHIAKRKD